MTGDLPRSRDLFLQCGKLVRKKGNNLEKFCARRVSLPCASGVVGSCDAVPTQGLVYKQRESPLMSAEVLMMAVEVMYLWRALPCCPAHTKEDLLDRLEGVWSRDYHTTHMAKCSAVCPSSPADARRKALPPRPAQLTEGCHSRGPGANRQGREGGAA